MGYHQTRVTDFLESSNDDLLVVMEGFFQSLLILAILEQNPRGTHGLHFLVSRKVAVHITPDFLRTNFDGRLKSLTLIEADPYFSRLISGGRKMFTSRKEIRGASETIRRQWELYMDGVPSSSRVLIGNGPLLSNIDLFFTKKRVLRVSHGLSDEMMSKTLGGLRTRIVRGLLARVLFNHRYWGPNIYPMTASEILGHDRGLFERFERLSDQLANSGMASRQLRPLPVPRTLVAVPTGANSVLQIVDFVGLVLDELEMDYGGEGRCQENNIWLKFHPSQAAEPWFNRDEIQSALDQFCSSKARTARLLLAPDDIPGELLIAHAKPEVVVGMASTLLLVAAQFSCVRQVVVLSTENYPTLFPNSSSFDLEEYKLRGRELSAFFQHSRNQKVVSRRLKSHT